MIRYYYRFATACALLISLSACVNVPAPGSGATLVDLPETWGGSAQPGDIDAQWWLRFDDSLLAAYVAAADLENPQIGQAVAQLDQARQQAVIAGADRLPQLSAMFNASRAQQTLAGSGLGSVFPDVPDGGGATSFHTDNFGLSLNIDWEIDIWGRIASQHGAALQDYLASENRLHAVRQSIAAQASKAYFAVIEAREQVAFSEETVEALAETARQVTNRADVGTIPQSDAEFSIANLESAKAGLEQRHDALQQAERQLQLLLREYPSGNIETAASLPSLPPMPPAGLPAELLARRPDVAAAERAVFAAGLRAQAARRSLLPAISLTGAYGNQSNELDRLLNGDSLVWSIAGQLVQPIFQGGRLRANVALSDAREREAAEAYIATVLTALSEVETALTRDAFLTRRAQSLLRAAEAAEEARRIGINRYREGLVPFITVLESQQRAIDARSAYISTRRARLDNRVDLHLALGGGFGAPTPQEFSQ